MLVLHILSSTVILGGALCLVRPMTVGDLIGVLITMTVVCVLCKLWFTGK